jgi:hypothetical protein
MHPVLRLAAALAIGALPVALPTVALVRALPVAAATPAPAPAASSEPQCPVRVLDVVALSSADSLASRTYLVTFETPGLSPGRMSGTVALFSGNHRYDIPFHGIVAAGSVASTLNEATPVVVRFSSALTIDAAYVSALGGADGGPCSVAYVWQRPAHAMLGARAAVMNGFADDLRRRVASFNVIDAPAPATEPKSDCTHPNSAPTLKSEPPRPPADPKATGFYVIEVSLSESGSVVDSWLWGSASAPVLAIADAELQHAKTATYSPATFRCRAIPSVVFVEDDFKKE